MSNFDSDAKKLYEAMKAKAAAKADAARDKQLGKYDDKARKAANQTPKSASDIRVPPVVSKAQTPKSSKSKNVKAAEPATAKAKEIKTTKAVAKKPKIVPEKARKATMPKGVAKAAPSVKEEVKALKAMKKIPSVKASRDSMAKELKATRSPKGPLKMAPQAEKIASEMLEETVEDNMFGKLKRDLPKAGAKMAMHEESELGKAAGKSAFKAIGKRTMAEGLESAARKAMVAGVVAGPVGIGLQALMESLDAEPGSPEEHNKMAERAAKAPSMGRVAPRSQLPSKLPSQVKQPQQRSDWKYAPEDHDQARMEDDFAKEAQRWMKK